MCYLFPYYYTRLQALKDSYIISFYIYFLKHDDIEALELGLGSNTV